MIEEAKADKTAYFKAMMANHTGTCLCIERKYGLEGYPPEVVTAGLNAACQGENAANDALRARVAELEAVVDTLHMHNWIDYDKDMNPSFHECHCGTCKALRALHTAAEVCGECAYEEMESKLKARIAGLETSLAEMLHWFGHPRRKEWGSKESFEDALGVERRALETLNHK